MENIGSRETAAGQTSEAVSEQVSSGDVTTYRDLTMCEHDTQTEKMGHYAVNSVVIC
jgi:hypothetical protein